MGSVIQFEERAVAALRERLGAAETARADLLAFARGHSGAVAAIHQAVIAAMEASSFDDLTDVVTKRWPDMLGLDFVAMALVIDGKGFRIDAAGVSFVERQIIERALGLSDVALRSVGGGHPLFGQSAAAIRAEALVGLGAEDPYPRGLLLLGQRAENPASSDEGASLLEFLGAALGAMLRRWAMNG